MSSPANALTSEPRIAADAEAALAALVRECCVQDVRAFKPGNVAIGAPGHDMSADDFLRSAEAVAVPLTRAGQPVGQRIEAAIEATWQRVHCNTNLGIVLLLAPLLRAMERVLLSRTDGAGTASALTLRDAVSATLAGLDQADAAACYRAIRRAHPGGLGHVERHDVGGEPDVTLLTAMKAAAEYDGIARAYASGFVQVFDVGLPALQLALGAGLADLWAVTRCYLTLLASFPDTHVARQHGPAVAEEVSRTARDLLLAWPAGTSPAAIWPELKACDQRWKEAAINPGTTADLVVATVLVMRLHEAHGYNAARPLPGASVSRERPETVTPGKRKWAPSH